VVEHHPVMLALRSPLLPRPAYCALILLICGGILALPAFASHNLLANGRFDSGNTSWTLQTGSGATMTWDPVVGNPSAGSLVLEGTYMGTADVLGEALSECFDIPSGHQLELHARTLAELDEGFMRCQPYITAYQLPGCAGSRTRLGAGGGILGNELGVWQDQSSTFTTTGGASYRVALALWLLGGNGPATCHFDSIVFAEQGTAGLVEVPATTPVGLWLLIAGLIGSALVVLRRNG